MLGLVLTGVAFIGMGIGAQFLPRSTRWVDSVLSSQNRLPALLRGTRRLKTEADLKLGVAAFSAFAVLAGLALLALAFYVGLT